MPACSTSEPARPTPSSSISRCRHAHTPASRSISIPVCTISSQLQPCREAMPSARRHTQPRWARSRSSTCLRSISRAPPHCLCRSRHSAICMWLSASRLRRARIPPPRASRPPSWRPRPRSCLRAAKRRRSTPPLPRPTRRVQLQDARVSQRWRSLSACPWSGSSSYLRPASRATSAAAQGA